MPRSLYRLAIWRGARSASIGSISGWCSKTSGRCGRSNRLRARARARPTLADAHFNLARQFEQVGRRVADELVMRRAVRHLKRYRDLVRTRGLIAFCVRTRGQARARITAERQRARSPQRTSACAGVFGHQGRRARQGFAAGPSTRLGPPAERRRASATALEIDDPESIAPRKGAGASRRGPVARLLRLGVLGALGGQNLLEHRRLSASRRALPLYPEGCAFSAARRPCGSGSAARPAPRRRTAGRAALGGVAARRALAQAAAAGRERGAARRSSRRSRARRGRARCTTRCRCRGASRSRRGTSVPASQSASASSDRRSSRASRAGRRSRSPRLVEARARLRRQVSYGRQLEVLVERASGRTCPVPAWSGSAAQNVDG